MIKIKLSLAEDNNISHVIFKEVYTNIKWHELESIMSQTEQFLDLKLYYHGAKLWHLVDNYNYNAGTFIEDNYMLKDIVENENDIFEIYLTWEEDECPDSP